MAGQLFLHTRLLIFDSPSPTVVWAGDTGLTPFSRSLMLLFVEGVIQRNKLDQ